MYTSGLSTQCRLRGWSSNKQKTSYLFNLFTQSLVQFQPYIKFNIYNAIMDKKLKDLLEEKSDDWIVENLLPRHIKWGTRTIIRRSDINWKHLRTKVKYVWYCWPMLIRNFCIDYKKNWWQFDEAVEAWLLYRSV